MIRKYCDRCNIELGNTYWRNPKANGPHSIDVVLNSGKVVDALLCLDCFKKTETEIYNLFNWYFKKEEEEKVKMGI